VNFGAATYGLGLIAGVLSTLSPCVLPLVPVLIASAVGVHRWGALALGTGLALSFAIVGTAIAALGASLAIDPESFRIGSAVILIIFGVVLVAPPLQTLFARATSMISESGDRLLARATIDGFAGQLLVGLLLGVVWSPCVGPTLGAATTLASQGKDLGQIAMLMLTFGIGAAMPLIALGLLSRATLVRVRGRLLGAGKLGKQLLGSVMIGIGVLICAGVDKSVEILLLNHTPDWLNAMTTRF
jgi:cytochrome c biogenesis protein CcdA